MALQSNDFQENLLLQMDNALLRGSWVTAFITWQIISAWEWMHQIPGCIWLWYGNYGDYILQTTNMLTWFKLLNLTEIHAGSGFFFPIFNV